MRDVYARFGFHDALTLRWRDGGHGVVGDTVAGYLDWADAAVGRSARRGHTEIALHGPWVPWPATRAPAPEWAPRSAAELAGAMRAALGGSDRIPGPRAALPVPELGKVPIRRLRTTGGVAVDLLGPNDPAAPLVLWLAPLCRATGWLAG